MKHRAASSRLAIPGMILKSDPVSAKALLTGFLDPFSKFMRITQIGVQLSDLRQNGQQPVSDLSAFVIGLTDTLRLTA